jgi:hypothetical protein
MEEPKNPYDITEATALLARSHEKRAPKDHYKQREQAVRNLCDAVVEAAKNAGYDTGAERGGHAISHYSRGSVSLRVNNDGQLVIVAPGPPQTQTSMDEMPIEYDPFAGIFVGKEEDIFYTPEPGKPRKRRSAVSVVAEEIIKMIDVQSEARRNVR